MPLDLKRRTQCFNFSHAYLQSESSNTDRCWLEPSNFDFVLSVSEFTKTGQTEGRGRLEWLESLLINNFYEIIRIFRRLRPGSSTVWDKANEMRTVWQQQVANLTGNPFICNRRRSESVLALWCICADVNSRVWWDMAFFTRSFGVYATAMILRNSFASQRTENAMLFSLWYYLDNRYI